VNDRSATRDLLLVELARHGGPISQETLIRSLPEESHRVALSVVGALIGTGEIELHRDGRSILLGLPRTPVQP
jgi:hypothetical protein